MDNITPEKRHFVMSQVKSTDTRPEEEIRSALHKLGFRFRKNDKRYPGKPDIVFPKYFAVIFVNGCFWHGHKNCKKLRIPKTNTEYWTSKIEKNKERDLQEYKKLQSEGWRIGIVWECSITGKKRSLKIHNVAESIALWLEEGFDEILKDF